MQNAMPWMKSRNAFIPRFTNLCLKREPKNRHTDPYAMAEHDITKIFHGDNGMPADNINTISR